MRLSEQTRHSWILCTKQNINNFISYIHYNRSRRMKSELQNMDQRQRAKNKSRLLAQNKKLNSQIRNLEKEISEIVATRQNEMIKNYEQNNNDFTKQRQQIIVQEKYIRKLKSKIDFLKSANTKGNAQFIIKEEDDLLLLKKEHQSMIIEKSVVDRFKQDKLKVLDKDKPFEQHKKQIEQNLASVKKSNRTMQAQIVQLQREVRKFHNYIVLNNTLSRDKKQVSQLQYQIAKNEHEIKQSQQKCRELQQKWKSQLDALDTELFQLKSRHGKTQAKLNQIQRDHRMWETRKNGLRDQEEIMEFRDRLSKVQMLPQSKQLSNVIKTKKKNQKISTSELIKLSKEQTENTDKRISQDLDDKKSLRQTDHKQEQKLLDNKNKKIKQLRKSDKNIILDPSESNKQNKDIKGQGKNIEQKEVIKQKVGQKGKQKQRQKEQAKNQNQNSLLKNDKQKQKNKKQLEVSNPKDKILQNQIKGKQKTEFLKRQNSKQDKNQKNDIKSQKLGVKKPTDSPKKSTQLVKQKSDPKLGIAKKQQKNVGTNTKNNNMEVKSSTASPNKQTDKIENKNPDIKAKGNKSPKQTVKQQKDKKPAKLLLKSVGVGTS